MKGQWMKVKDLLEKLQTLNPEYDILICSEDDDAQFTEVIITEDDEREEVRILGV